MKPPVSRFAFGTSLRMVVHLAVITAVFGLASRSFAQRRAAGSGPATITLTATLRQSLTMSVSRTIAFAPFYSSSDLFGAEVADGKSSLTISAHWVRGPGNVSVLAFSQGNPLLGRAGLEIVPVGAASPATDGAASSGENFLSSSNPGAVTASPGLYLHTQDLEVPRGSAGQFLTIRADVP